ncbi:MAG TPA: hypothetical protein VGE14_16175 [Marmoricola sp.]
MTGARRRAAACAFVVGAAAALIGCGEDDRSPGETVPAMASALATVDAAIVEGDFDRARTSLTKLVRTTTRARDDGTISEGEADRVLAAVATLMTALPEESPPAAPTPPPAPSPSDKDRDEKDGEGGDDGEKKDEEKDGDGHDSENGPDDGHGN